MISHLETLSKARVNAVGQLAYDLITLNERGVRVVATIILRADLFRTFQKASAIQSSYIDELLEIICKGDFENSREVIVRVSVPRAYDGLVDKIRVRKTYASLKAAIERIYRSWSGDRARASRIANSIPDRDSYLTLLIQPWPNRLVSFGTRDPISGQPTDALNFRIDPDTSLVFKSKHAQLAKRVDTILRRPVEMYILPRKHDCQMVYIEEELMSQAGSIEAHHSYLREGLISDVEYLRRIESEMIGYFSSYELPKGISMRGMPASAGIVEGQLIFRDSETISIGGDAAILLVNDYLPDDRHLMDHCVGAIGTRGGMLSHLARISRYIGISAVVGCGGDLIERARTYRLPSGEMVKEFSNVALDGALGMVVFPKPNSFIDARYASDRTIEPYLEQLWRTILRVKQRKRFQEISIRDQYHIAELIGRLRKIGFIE